VDLPASAEPLIFPLRGRDGAIRLDAGGLHHPSGARRGVAYTPYADLTHLATSTRALWLGARRSVYVLGRSQFEDESGPENLVRALLERIAAQPEGSRQLARMAEVEELARHPGTLYATRGLAVVCTLVYALQILLGEHLHLVGSFTGGLFLDGDWWRAVTANLLHGFLLHLVLNLLGLLALGPMVERPLGTARTVSVMAVSAAGAMLASGVASTIPVVGVSGIVFGLLGAVLWLEFRYAEALPAWWRVPRRGLYWMLGISALLTLVPIIAGAAHVGGLLGGLAAAALLTHRSLGQRRPSPPAVRAFASASLAVAAVAVGTAAWLAANPAEYVVRHAERLLQLESTTADELNNVAWILAVDPDADDRVLELALGLAERAVAESGRSEAHILDTLAEVHFQRGDPEAALAAIDEAIALKPDRDYYHEQKRRFLGEREPEDRPFYDPREDAPAEEPETPAEPGLRI